jgi:hypothetical protein
MDLGSTAPPRYRCRACGNLTRFDVVSTIRSTAFHHYSVGGALSVEDPVVLEASVESVTCRWCGPSGVVETVHDDSDSMIGDSGDAAADDG